MEGCGRCSGFPARHTRRSVRSRTSKAFSNKQTVKQCGCTEVYRDCLHCFLPALSCPVQRGALRSSVRSFLHRMIICLEEEVLPFVPAASEHMLKDCEAKDLQEFIPLISQITAKFKVRKGRPRRRRPRPRAR